MTEEREPIDYEKLQRELSERPGSRICDACEVMSYDQIFKEYGREPKSKLRDAGWEHGTAMAGMVRRCAECKAFNASKPFAWIADIDSERFVAFMQAHDCAFALDDLRECLPQDHPVQPRNTGLLVRGDGTDADCELWEDPLMAPDYEYDRWGPGVRRKYVHPSRVPSRKHGGGGFEFL